MPNQFLTNYTETTFLEKIKDNLRHCSSFDFSVSFIKKAGLVLLYKDIEAAVERGCKGRIITSTYQNFTDIESLKSFYTLMGRCPNFQCHLDYESFHDNSYATLGYHSKGYLLQFEDHRELVVGSSNITRYALLKNVEWDVAVSDNFEIGVFDEAEREFEDKWDATECLTIDLIHKYSTKLNFAIERWDMDYDLSVSKIKPNYMQKKALKELNRYRAMGVNRALTIASAGSGKTYLAAFDALNFNPKRLLYIVHEGSILKKSLETFQEIFGKNVTYGIYSGTSKESDADFVFATNITMSNTLELFSKREFDYIIIDECHHATAETYKKIIGYFEPEFLLGLTATPERLDNQDVFELFDHNVPYELRLRDAIANDLVVPFKYYGIRDQLVDYGLSRNEERRMIAQMAQEEHCDFISEQIEKHRPQGKLKALAFCRNVTHARMMCESLGERYKTAYLTGRNDIGERVRAYNDLQNDAHELEILFTVDILNEGVDIPGVNMVLFLRPTESTTIFIQQLGRGLRKYTNKDYVTVLDFIGNSYKRSVQIAFALGSLSENFVMEKRLMASLIKDDFTALGLADYGVEIHIDDLSKEEILEYIDKENFRKEELDHALTYLQLLKVEDDVLKLDVELDDQFIEYVQDLIEYGLTRYIIDTGNENGFKLWQNYRMDQVQLKLLKNPANNQVGTYYYDDFVVIFASLKKDLDAADKLNYKDKFLQSDVFQWESMTNLPQSHLEKLTRSRFAHLFIRKVSTENGLVLPFTYVGKGKLSNPRKTDGGNGTYLFDIHMDNMLPDYLQYDFGLTKE